MSRPRLRRHTCVKPQANNFKPQGIPLRDLEFIHLTPEETEAIWLSDYRNLDQVDSAKHMETSQSTFQRILKSAHHKIAQALIDGEAITIENLKNN